MKTNDVFPSKYLKAEDELFDGGDVVATIKEVIKEKMGRGDDEKPVMYFRELSKGMVLNKTNWATCEKMFNADDSDDWIGEKVALYVTEVDSFGDVVKAIRVRSSRPVNKQEILDRYQKLYERAVAAKVDGISDYVVSPNMTESEIIDLGKELKKKVEAAEQF